MSKRAPGLSRRADEVVTGAPVDRLATVVDRRLIALQRGDDLGGGDRLAPIRGTDGDFGVGAPDHPGKVGVAAGYPRVLAAAGEALRPAVLVAGDQPGIIDLDRVGTTPTESALSDSVPRALEGVGNDRDAAEVVDRLDRRVERFAGRGEFGDADREQASTSGRGPGTWNPD